MTPVEFRRYVADPARDGNPAIVAARVMLADRDRLAAAALAHSAELAEMRGDLASYRAENERLRTLLSGYQRAPWEEGRADGD